VSDWRAADPVAPPAWETRKPLKRFVRSWNDPLAGTGDRHTLNEKEIDGLMIQVSNLTKYYGPVLAIDHITFEVGRGEIVGFLGPNGSGKTTTMRILTSYLPATSGIAKVAGFDVMTQSLEVRRHIGYLPESVPLYGEMRVEEYLNYRAKLKGVGRKERPARLDYCLDRCRIREVRRRLVGTLSRGYRQRVGLADAMIHDPPILILDEPTAGLDPLQIRETLALIQSLSENHTILLSTHILSEVEAVCDRVIMINAGRIALERSLEELETEAVIVLEVRAPSDQAAGVLRSVAGVTQVVSAATEDGVSRFEVHTHEDQDLREALAQAVAHKGWPLRRLERKRRRLEDAFFDVLRAEDPLKGHT
jgi:ABC-2 type transport system ATP-binding protein